MKSCFIFLLPQKFNSMTFQLYSLFNKQIINCQQTPLQQVSKMCLFRDHCEDSKFMFTVSGLFNPLFQHLLRNPVSTLSFSLSTGAMKKKFSFYFTSFLKSLCADKPDLTQAGICSATYFLPFHCLLMKGYIHVQNKFD